jgi:hypothetical protein
MQRRQKKRNTGSERGTADENNTTMFKDWVLHYVTPDEG